MKQPEVLRVFAIVGGVFTFLGGVYFVVGIWCLVNADWTAKQVRVGNMPVSMFICGNILLLCVGLGSLMFYRSSVRYVKRLKTTGKELLAEVISVEEDWSVVVNGQPTAMVSCLYEGHEFRTGGISWKRIPMAPGRMFVKLYVGDTWDNFYVDASTMHVVEQTAYQS